jgi:hypothetical protein
VRYFPVWIYNSEVLIKVYIRSRSFAPLVTPPPVFSNTYETMLPYVTFPMFSNLPKNNHYRRPPIPTISAQVDPGPVHVMSNASTSEYSNHFHLLLLTSAAMRYIGADQAEPVLFVLQMVPRKS